MFALLGVEPKEGTRILLEDAVFVGGADVEGINGIDRTLDKLLAT